MHKPFHRMLLIGSMVFPLLLLGMGLLFALLLGGLPNGVQFQVTADWSFFQILWQDNAWGAVKLVLLKPLVVVERFDLGAGLQLWGLFYYAGTLLMYLLISLFTAWHWRRVLNGSAKQRMLFAVGVVALLIGVTYLRRAACCGSGPNWVLDSWLLANAYVPYLGGMDWLQVYQRMHPWMKLVQMGMLLGGTATLYGWYLHAKQARVRP